MSSTRSIRSRAGGSRPGGSPFRLRARDLAHEAGEDKGFDRAGSCPEGPEAAQAILPAPGPFCRHGPPVPRRPLPLLLVQSLLPLLVLGACAAPASTPATAPPAIPAAAASAPEPAPAPLEPELARKLDALADSLEKERVTLHLPGLALAIVQDDRLIFARGFGLADVEAQRPVTPETLFAIGSTTKAFTATLVGMLADEKKLALDDPITKYIPWFTLPIQAKEGEQVTIRDLLSHRTGFARMDILGRRQGRARRSSHGDAGRADGALPRSSSTTTSCSWPPARLRGIAARPGRARARAPPRAARDALDRHERRRAQRDPRLALGYRWDKEGRLRHLPMRNLVAIAPAGAINSNVLDMSRWVRFQLGHGELEGRRLISREAFDEGWKTQNTMTPQARYGLAWMLHEWQGQPYVEHGGNIDGFAAEVALLPDSHLGLVMLANVGATPLQGSIGPEVFAALLGEPEASAPIEAAHEDFSRFTGIYVANYLQFHDAPFEVRVQNERLALDVPGQMVFELLPPGPDGKRAFAMIPEQIQADFEGTTARSSRCACTRGGMMFDLRARATRRRRSSTRRSSNPTSAATRIRSRRRPLPSSPRADASPSTTPSSWCTSSSRRRTTRSGTSARRRRWRSSSTSMPMAWPSP